MRRFVVIVLVSCSPAPGSMLTGDGVFELADASVDAGRPDAAIADGGFDAGGDSDACSTLGSAHRCRARLGIV